MSLQIVNILKKFPLFPILFLIFPVVKKITQFFLVLQNIYYNDHLECKMF